LSVAIATAGCGDDAAGGDGGRPDGGVDDGGTMDAGSGDGAAPDGETDAGPTPSDLVGEELRLVAASEGGTRTGVGEAWIPITAPRPAPLVVNVVADLDGDGAIAPFDAGGTVQEEWLVRDLPVVVVETVYTFRFALAPSVAGNVLVKAVLSATPLGAAPEPGTPAGDAERETTVTVEVVDRAPVATPGDGFIGAGGGVEPFDLWTCETVGDMEVPGGLYRNGYPDVPQSANSCVLHSVAGSLSWLARANGFADCLTGMTADGTEFGVDSSEAINELAFALEATAMFQYDPVRGVLPDRLVPGKDRIAAAMGIPIRTTTTMADSFAAIQAALQMGCAVELVLAFPPMMGRHMVSVAGYVDGAPGRSLSIRDGATDSFNDVYDVMPGTGAAPTVVRGFPFRGAQHAAQIELVVVECVGEVQAVTLDYDHGPHPAGTVVHLACITGGRVSGMEAGCDGPHLHGDPIMIRTDGTFPDTAPMSCGHGRVAMFAVRDLDVACWQPL
jgi:hypothetical protein